MGFLRENTNTPFTQAQLSVKTTGPGLMTWACGFSGPVLVYTGLIYILIKWVTGYIK